VAIPTRYISLFSGAGGLDLAVRLALPSAECVCHVEGEIPAAEVLAARMREGTLDDAPIWSDVRTFDGHPWCGLVDGIIGGFPCQDLSVAGKRVGIDGEKSGLWGEFRRIIAEVSPEWVFIENVPGLVSSLTLLHRSDVLGHYDRLRGAAKTARDRWYVEAHIERLHRRLLKEHGISALLYVCCQLEELDYRVAVEEIAASDIGAPHKRERVFVLAYAANRSGTWLNANSKRESIERWPDSLTGSPELALPPQRGRGELRKPSGRDGQPDGGGGDMGDSDEMRTGRTVSVRDGRQGRDGYQVAGRELANPGDRLIPQPGRGPEERAGAGSAGEVLDDSTSPRFSRREAGEGATPRYEARLRESGGRCDGLAHAASMQPEQYEGSRSRPSETEGSGAFSELAGCGDSLFPPGPGAITAWRELLVRRPWMRPAISQEEIESPLCHCTDGLANLVVQQRTDALRAAGNGVVALCGAVAFVELVRRTDEATKEETF